MADRRSIMIAMSGGVDSAAAAFLAGQQADKTAGVTMLHCPAHNPNAYLDVQDAAALCTALGIPHFSPDLSQAFADLVIDPFIREYREGRTPNPCVDCNKAIKFGILLDFAIAKGYDRLATGHYARVEHTAARTLLRRASDTSKDQSYVLYSLSQDVLSRVVFPLGELTKTQVRALASEQSFPMAKKRDSQDICFIPNGDYVSFIKRLCPSAFIPGSFCDKNGNCLGRHDGIIGYTIGQRKGLGIAAGHPIYVVDKSAQSNLVTIGEQAELFSTELVANRINFIPFDRLDRPMRVLAKVRYRQEATPAVVEQTDSDRVTVRFEQPQRAISPGQSLVLYDLDYDYVIGGGRILLAKK